MWGKKEIDWNKIFEKARAFAKEYSEEITIVDFVQQQSINNYPCVQLEFPIKGNNELLKKLLNSGYCTKMDGHVTDGKRIACVLLWFDKKGDKFSKWVPMMNKELTKV